MGTITNKVRVIAYDDDVALIANTKTNCIKALKEKEAKKLGP